MTERTLMLSLQRVHSAYDAVRTGKVRTVPLRDIYRVLQRAHTTEFFTRDEQIVVERIESARLAA